MEKKKSKLLSEIKKMYENDSNRNVFKKFIEYIRFPFFKNFENNLKVNFSFPITFIVGQNGAGKSSLLHALYGAPKGKSVEEFWYTTDLDPIKDLKDNRHCFIYSYKTEFTKQNIEVLKIRIQNRDKKTGKINPDYWEPSRPIKKYGMADFPDSFDKREATKTRWKLIQRSVYLMDFRYSLSAYDKYFYFGSKPNTKTLKSKQDIIRKYAPKLRRAFDDEREISFYSRRVSKINNLTNEVKDRIEYILGKKYAETKLIEHNFYDRNTGFAIRYKTDKISYSEAYAGSGETAIVKLVHDLMNAKNYSLVLLDEPETSLHPLAQKKLINFILKQIKKKKLQVVISTHSPDIIEGMPKEAIKIFYEKQDTGKINIIEDVYPENAFIHIGRSITDKKVIIVEDSLAKMIVEKVIEQKGDSKLFEVEHFPGGESPIKQNEMTVYSKEDNSKHFIVFDGDQKKEKIDVSTLSDKDKETAILAEKIKELVDEKIKFSVDSNASDEQKKDLMLKYIKYHHGNVFFLPKNIPEEIIWDNGVLERADLTKGQKDKIKTEEDIKKKFNLFAKYSFGENSAEYQTKAYEYFLIKWIKKENSDYSKIKKIINNIKEK